MLELTADQVTCRLAEYDLANNLDAGKEYTGFKGLYDSMLEKGHVSKYGRVYDISDSKDSLHILKFLEKIEKEEDCPKVTMTTGSFFAMNKKLQKKVVSGLVSLSKNGGVNLYSGEDVKSLFKNTGVRVNIFEREKRFIPHFIKTEKRFNFALPHTEKKLIRVDINSETFENQQTINDILRYFDLLITELDKVIELDNRMVRG